MLLNFIILFVVSVLFPTVAGMRTAFYNYDGEAGKLDSNWYTEVWLWTLMWSAIICFYEFVFCRWLFALFSGKEIKK